MYAYSYGVVKNPPVGCSTMLPQWHLTNGSAICRSINNPNYKHIIDKLLEK